MKGNMFIKRPVMAISISVLILAIGLISLFTLPVEQYPDIAPPTVYVTASYTGADAEAVMNSVIMPLEESINGVEDMMYISSSASNAGLAIIQVYFKQGTDPDMAAVNVQNRVAKAQGLLPAEVTKVGVSTMKRQTSFLQIGALVCTDGRYDQTFLANYLDINVIPQIKRIEGVGDVMELGDTYSMRIWLKPERMAQYGLVPSDITAVLGEQNIEAPTGSLGESSQNVFQFTMKYRGRLKSVEEFQNTVVRSREDGSILRLKDVAEVELGTMTYSFRSEMDSQPAVLYMIFQTAGSNATAVNKEITAQIERMEKNLPEGTEFVTMMSSNDFLYASINEVVKTLIEAIILVIIVMFLFLQNWRATLIPTVAVPVVLLGTFAILKATGFTLNMLTMFGLVLAIGLLVDDAIVVVENVERVMREDGTDARTATIKSMTQITGALVGVAMVLSAVFIPMAFFGGSTGVIYRQFSITIVSAMLLSVLVALSLTPALCASILKPIDNNHLHKGGFFGAFNRGFERVSTWVRDLVLWTHHHIALTFVGYAVIWACVIFGFMKLPGSFVPDEDQGSLMFTVQTPAGSTQEHVTKAEDAIRNYFLKTRKDVTDSVFQVAGFSLAGGGQNMGLGFVKLKDWADRTAAGTDPQTVALKANIALSQYKDAQIIFFAPPAIPELGIADGFDMYIEDRGGQGHQKLMEVRNQFLGMANQDPRLRLVRPNGMEDTPQYKLEMDREKLQSYGISLDAANTVLSTVWGGSYVNLFIDRERVKRVYVQGDPDYRMAAADLSQWYVRNSSGGLVPFSAFSTGSWTSGSPRLERFNANPAVNIQGNAAVGVSSGTAMQAVEEIASKLPSGFSIEWNGVSYQEKMASQAAAPLYALSLLVVFLCLAALYESWTIPISIILVVPTGVLGALAMTALLGGHNDVYFQVGMLTTIGLVSKNAILIVEFAKMLYDAGEDLITASLDAVKLRFRPIVMTSLAFGLGVVPLVLAHGAGAGAQNAIGMAVLGGIITGTILCVGFVPMFYVVVNRLFRTRRRQLPEDVKENVQEK